MTVSRATTILSAVIAIFVACAVQVVQLRTASTAMTCCCPDPSTCHCPKETAHHDTRPTVRACHRSQHDLAAPAAPMFAMATVAIDAPLGRVVDAPASTPGAPHPSPDPARPSGPS